MFSQIKPTYKVATLKYIQYTAGWIIDGKKNKTHIAHYKGDKFEKQIKINITETDHKWILSVDTYKNKEILKKKLKAKFDGRDPYNKFWWCFKKDISKQKIIKKLTKNQIVVEPI